MKKTNLFFAGVVLIVLMSSCATPVVVSTPTPTNTPINTSTPTPTNTPTLVPTNTPTPTITLTPTPEYMDFPLTWAGIYLQRIVDSVPEFTGMVVERCGSYADEWEELSGLPAVIYTGESWEDSYCLDSLVISREPGQQYTIFGFVVEVHNIKGLEDGYYVFYFQASSPRGDVDGKKGFDLWESLGATKNYLSSGDLWMAPVYAFGVKEADFYKYINTQLLLFTGF